MNYKALLLPVLGLSAAAYGNDNNKPNVLFILTDDLQAGAIHAMGNGQTITPHIDELMRHGTSFTNAYVNGGLSGAISMPSRAMLMTGRTLFEIESDGMKIPESHTTMAEHYLNNGYATFATGKWHSDIKSFSRSFSCGDNIFFGGMHRYELNGHRSPRLHHFDPTGEYADTQFIADGFSSEIYAGAAIDFIEKASLTDKPFFAYIAFTSPHDPRNNLPDYGYKYRHDLIEVPCNFAPEHPFDNGDLTVRDEVIVPAPRTKEDVKRELAFYYGMVSEVDLQIGRVIAALKRSGQYDNTIIVFASDNGLAVGQHGLLGKQNLYQHSTKVPLILIGKGIRPGASDDSYCYLSDLFPTLCSLTGLDTPRSVTGISIVKNKNGGEKQRDNIMLAYSNLQRAYIRDGWKLIMYNVKGNIKQQLFNIDTDPFEINDLSSDPAYRNKVKEYETMLAKEMIKRNDFCNLLKPGWGYPEKLNFQQLISIYKF